MTMYRLDVRGLRVIRALEEHGSASRAASALGHSPAAVSQMVQRLETLCGTPLVERRGGAIGLTEAGRVLSHCCATVMRELEAIDSELAAIAE